LQSGNLRLNARRRGEESRISPTELSRMTRTFLGEDSMPGGRNGKYFLGKKKQVMLLKSDIGYLQSRKPAV
jgi:hypothetical protein